MSESQFSNIFSTTKHTVYSSQTKTKRTPNSSLSLWWKPFYSKTQTYNMANKRAIENTLYGKQGFLEPQTSLWFLRICGMEMIKQKIRISLLDWIKAFPILFPFLRRKLFRLKKKEKITHFRFFCSIFLTAKQSLTISTERIHSHEFQLPKKP